MLVGSFRVSAVLWNNCFAEHFSGLDLPLYLGCVTHATSVQMCLCVLCSPTFYPNRWPVKPSGKYSILERIFDIILVMCYISVVFVETVEAMCSSKWPHSSGLAPMMTTEIVCVIIVEYSWTLSIIVIKRLCVCIRRVMYSCIQCSWGISLYCCWTLYLSTS